MIGILLILIALSGLTACTQPPADESANVDSKNAAATRATTAAANESPPIDAELPVPNERPAAKAIRTLGGWYRLDPEHHVTEVNMVNDYNSIGERQENEQKTDQALAHLPDFVRLKRLFLAESQVSDDGLEFVGRLAELEELFVWDAKTVTDKGVAHLRALPKLKFLKLGETAISDEAVAHLSVMSSIETLLLDGNALTDKTLEYAARLPRLRELDIGFYGPENRRPRITAEGLKHVRDMPTLEQLCIPYVPATGQDLKELLGLKQLKVLRLEDVLFDGDVNEAAIRELQGTIPNLKVVTDDKLFPSLKRIAEGADPRQHEIYRKQGADGLRTIDEFLGLMWAKRDVEAAKLCDSVDAVADCRRFRSAPEFKLFKVTMAYADADNILAITDPPVMYSIYELDDMQQRREIGKQTSYVTVRATRINGIWRVKDTNLLAPGPEGLLKWFRPFLVEYPGAQALRPSTPSKP